MPMLTFCQINGAGGSQPTWHWCVFVASGHFRATQQTRGKTPMTRKNLMMMAVLVALTGAGVAFAAEQQASDAGKSAFARIDTNGDGFIDKTEAAKFPRLAARFDELDKNKDGKLSKDEVPFLTHMGGMGRMRFHRSGPMGRGGMMRGGEGFLAKFDTNKDGRISRDEAKASKRLSENFDKLDVNKDGFIDKADFEVRMKQRRDALFDKLDTNKDGQLSRAEFEAMKPMWPGFGARGGQGMRDMRKMHDKHDKTGSDDATKK
jgi:Ca2+-binding EF-hand superfamily protein